MTAAAFEGSAGAPDPLDPQAIHDLLPEPERANFLAFYCEHAHSAAEDLGEYRRFKEFLRVWSLRARGMSRPDYDYGAYRADLEASRNGALRAVPFAEGIARALGVTAEEAEAFVAEQSDR